MQPPQLGLPGCLPPPSASSTLTTDARLPWALFQMKAEVLSHPERSSLIYSEHPFIVPGGRFVEFYYW